MQRDHVLKKLNFDLLTPPPPKSPGDETQAFDPKSRLICFVFIVPLSACEISVKNIDNLPIQIFDVRPHLRGQGGGGGG